MAFTQPCRIGSRQDVATAADGYGRWGAQARACLPGDKKNTHKNTRCSTLQVQRLNHEDSSMIIAADGAQGTVSSKRSHNIVETK
jgi:hypothetical protein